MAPYVHTINRSQRSKLDRHGAITAIEKTEKVRLLKSFAKTVAVDEKKANMGLDMKEVKECLVTSPVEPRNPLISAGHFY